MSDKTTIELLTVSNELRSLVGPNTNVYLPLLAGFALELTKLLEEVSRVQDIKKEAPLQISIPYNDKSHVALKKYVISNQDKSNVEPLLSVRVSSGYKVWQFDGLCVLNANDESLQYDCELSIKEYHWATKAKRILLKDIVAPEAFDFTESNMNILVANEFYTSGEEIHQWPLVHYGTKLNSFEYRRPWIWLTALWEIGFDRIGWCFSSQWWQSENIGRKLIGYYLKSEWMNYEGKSKSVFVGAGDGVNDKVYNSSPFNERIKFLTDSPNPPYFNDGSYQTGTGGNIIQFSYQHFDTEEIEVVVNLFLEIELDSTHMSFDIIHRIDLAHFETIPANNTLSVLHRSKDVLATSLPTKVIYELKNVSYKLKEGDALFVTYNAGRILENSYFSVSAKSHKKIYDGDLIDLSSMIDPELTLFDFIAGSAHLMNGKFVTDWGLKKISVYPPNTIDVPYGDFETERVTGYYKTQTTPLVIDTNVICNSKEVSTNKQSQYRYANVKFKDSSDKYITEVLRKDGENQIYRTFVDFGNKIRTEEIYLEENPLYEPTVSEATPDFLTTGGTPVVVPHLWDNTKVLGEPDEDPNAEEEIGENSCDIKPRVLVYIGEVTQPDENTGTRVWTDSQTGLTKFKVPMATERLNLEVSNGWKVAWVVYGGRELDTGFLGLYLYHQEEIREKIFSLIEVIDLYMSIWTYDKMDFRTLLYYHYKGRPHLRKLISVDSFSTDCQQISTITVRSLASDVCAFCPCAEGGENGGGGPGGENCILCDYSAEAEEDIADLEYLDDGVPTPMGLPNSYVLATSFGLQSFMFDLNAWSIANGYDPPLSVWYDETVVPERLHISGFCPELIQVISNTNPPTPFTQENCGDPMPQFCYYSSFWEEQMEDLVYQGLAQPFVNMNLPGPVYNASPAGAAQLEADFNDFLSANGYPPGSVIYEPNTITIIIYSPLVLTSWQEAGGSTGGTFSQANCGGTNCVVSLAQANTTGVYDIRLENPNDATFNFNLEAVVGVEGVNAVADCVVDKTEGGNTTEELRTTETVTIPILNRYANNSPMPSGSEIVSMKLGRNDTGAVVTLILNTGAYLNGPAGSVNASNLVYNGSNASNMAIELKKLIRNAIAAEMGGALIDNDYDLTVAVFNPGIFQITFLCKHLVGSSSQWIGIDTTNAALVYNDGSNNITRGFNRISQLQDTICTYPLGTCGTLSITRQAFVLAPTNTVGNYNDLSIVTPTVPISGSEGSDVLSLSCTTQCVEATATDCLTPVSYSWSLNGNPIGGNQNPICDFGPGTYICTVTEANNNTVTSNPLTI